VVGVLEDRRTHVLEIDAIEKFDGLAAVARKGGEVAAAAGARRGGFARASPTADAIGVHDPRTGETRTPPVVSLSADRGQRRRGGRFGR
jgi:hypothetical protein